MRKGTAEEALNEAEPVSLAGVLRRSFGLDAEYVKAWRRQTWSKSLISQEDERRRQTLPGTLTPHR